MYLPLNKIEDHILENFKERLISYLARISIIRKREAWSWNAFLMKNVLNSKNLFWNRGQNEFVHKVIPVFSNKYFMSNV